MKAWMVSATIWLWWAVVVGPAAWVVCSSISMTGGDRGYNNLAIDRVVFSVVNCDRKSYTAFIESLRSYMSSGTIEYGIPLMRAPSREPDFLLVELRDWDNEPITLVVNRINAYVIAYQARDRYYLLSDTDSNAIFGTNPHRLSFDGSYGELQRVAGENRQNIDLGITEFAQAILTLYFWSPPQTESSVARALIILIQMVSEAARFRTIEHRVRRNIISVGDYRSFRPGTGMLSLETNWQSLSDAVQESNEGVFASPVALQTADQRTEPIYNADRAREICGLALLLFTCRRQNQAILSPPHDSFSVSSSFLNKRSMLGADDTCENPEPTVRIIGRDGLCMAVKSGYYHNGNPIVLESCKNNLDVNQFWTFKRGGTIQSNGRCLTTYGYSPGVYVMIYDCSSAAREATLWTIYYGTIVNPRSGLAISAESGNIGSMLTVQTNVNASKQGWLPSNNTQPFLTPITGLNGLCMQANGGNVGLSTCDDNNSRQKWYLYGDGSIRPQTDRTLCATCRTDDERSLIVLLSCNLASANQRWMFTSQGTIFNLHNGYVMDVKGSAPTLQQIIIYHATGNPNQMWFTAFD